jgi:hypothetical protein
MPSQARPSSRGHRSKGACRLYKQKQGIKAPGPLSDSENTLILAQARENAFPLFGPEAKELLPEVSASAIRSAMRDGLPALLDGLHGDERNVLLTLARIWRTSELGDFMSKDAAAAWACPRLPQQEASILDYAREAYLGEIVDSWADRRVAAKATAVHIGGHITSPSCFDRNGPIAAYLSIARLE